MSKAVFTIALFFLFAPVPAFFQALPDLILKIEDHGWGSDPADEFKSQTFAGGVKMLNIDNTRSYIVQ